MLALAIRALVACGPRPAGAPGPAVASAANPGGSAPFDTARVRRSFDLGVVPPRPRLAAGADTNDAALYYEHGMAVFEGDPTEAAESFAWAARIDPGFAQAYYYRWLALQQPVPRGYPNAFIERPPSVAARIDSLAQTAFALNPFVATGEGRVVVGGDGRVDDFRLGLIEFREGRYEAAIRSWGRTLRERPDDVNVRVWRARAMTFLKRYADAAQELTVAIDAVRRAEDEGRVTPASASTATIEYAIGMLQEQRGDTAAAREAYQDAIGDNLGFYMAHARLAGLALRAHDTTTAMVESETAVGIRGDDPALRLVFALALLDAGRLDDAEREMREATRLDPDYAAPHLHLARLLERRGRPATDEWAAFAARARRDDPALGEARSRAAARRR